MCISKTQVNRVMFTAPTPKSNPRAATGVVSAFGLQTMSNLHTTRCRPLPPSPPERRDFALPSRRSARVVSLSFGRTSVIGRRDTVGTLYTRSETTPYARARRVSTCNL